MNEHLSPLGCSRRKCLVIMFLLLPVGWWGSEIARQQIELWNGRDLGLQARYAGATVDGIAFDRASRFGDQDWERLAPFRNIERLDLTFTQVTSRSLDNIGNFPNLTQLSVLVDQITTEQETRWLSERPQLFVSKYHLIDGVRVVDGYQ